MKSFLRWFGGALLGPAVAIFIVSVIPTPRSGQPTIASMANIGYAVVFFRHVVLFSLAYGIIFPLLMPRSSAKAVSSISAGMIIGAGLLAQVFYELNIGRIGGPDYFAAISWRNAIIATLVSLLTCFIVGLNKNPALSNAARWRGLKRRDNSNNDPDAQTGKALD